MKPFSAPNPSVAAKAPRCCVAPLASEYRVIAAVVALAAVDIAERKVDSHTRLTFCVLILVVAWALRTEGGRLTIERTDP